MQFNELTPEEEIIQTIQTKFSELEKLKSQHPKSHTL
jgi:hypothetical protein